MFSVRLFAAQSSSGEVPEMSLHFGFLVGTCSNRSTSSRIPSVLGKVVMMKFSQGVTGSHRGVPSPVPHPGEQQVEGPDPIPSPRGCPGGNSGVMDGSLHTLPFVMQLGETVQLWLGGKDD